jgi:hypothetical protein
MPMKGEGGSCAAELGVVVVIGVDIPTPISWSPSFPLGRTTRHGPRPGKSSSLSAYVAERKRSMTCVVLGFPSVKRTHDEEEGVP